MQRPLTQYRTLSLVSTSFPTGSKPTYTIDISGLPSPLKKLLLVRPALAIWALSLGSDKLPYVTQTICNLIQDRVLSPSDISEVLNEDQLILLDRNKSVCDLLRQRCLRSDHFAQIPGHFIYRLENPAIQNKLKRYDIQVLLHTDQISIRTVLSGTEFSAPTKSWTPILGGRPIKEAGSWRKFMNHNPSIIAKVMPHSSKP